MLSSQLIKDRTQVMGESTDFQDCRPVIFLLGEDYQGTTFDQIISASVYCWTPLQFPPEQPIIIMI